jgi:Protein of unknown function (DUF4238)
VAKRVMALTLETPERWKAQAKKAIADGYMKEGDDLNYEEVKEFFERGQFKLELRNERHIQLEVDTFDKLLPILIRRKWAILKAPQDSGGFITSDHPVVLAWSEPKMRGGITALVSAYRALRSYSQSRLASHSLEHSKLKTSS